MSPFACMSAQLWLLLLLLPPMAGATTGGLEQDYNTRAKGHAANVHALPVGKWIKIHQQKPGDRIIFRRQAHGGSAFDTHRNQLVLFGSDSHGQNWNNSLLLFDPLKLKWNRLYPDDHPDTYRVNQNGLPVAGRNDDHPWAMHTFAAVAYDAGRDELIISSFPGHMKPGRFTNALKHLWPTVRKHPTWVLDMRSGKWRALDTPATHFFPYATVFDSHRGIIIGYRESGIYELSGTPRRWRHIVTKGLLGYHNNAVYDSWHRKMLVMGSNEDSNEIIVYDPENQEQKRMPTRGERPPADQHIPMAFHTGIGKTVALIDRVPEGITWKQRDRTRTETWLYDLGTDQWQQLETAGLPFGCGMNYNLEYDPRQKILLLVTDEPDKPTSVWALRIPSGQ